MPVDRKSAWQANRECNYRLYRPIAITAAVAAVAVTVAVMLQPEYKIKNNKNNNNRKATTKITRIYISFGIAHEFQLGQ